jgi:hypothetical protein
MFIATLVGRKLAVGGCTHGKGHLRSSGRWMLTETKKRAAQIDKLQPIQG